MMFVPILSVAQIFVLFVLPLLGIAGTLILAGVLLVRWNARRSDSEIAPWSRAARRWCAGVTVLVLSLDVWSGFLCYQSFLIDRNIEARHVAKAKRENFVLERDFQY